MELQLSTNNYGNFFSVSSGTAEIIGITTTTTTARLHGQPRSPCWFLADPRDLPSRDGDID